jgi:hypothetical protein
VERTSLHGPARRYDSLGGDQPSEEPSLAWPRIRYETVFAPPLELEAIEQPGDQG